MITRTQAIERLYCTYNKYDVTRSTLEQLFDSANEQGFDIKQTYNVIRLALAHTFNEREYFSIKEVAQMLNISEEEVLKEVKEVNAEIIEGVQFFFSKGL